MTGVTEHAQGLALWAPCRVRFSNYSRLHLLIRSFLLRADHMETQCHNRRQLLAGGGDGWPPLLRMGPGRLVLGEAPWAQGMGLGHPHPRGGQAAEGAFFRNTLRTHNLFFSYHAQRSFMRQRS